VSFECKVTQIIQLQRADKGLVPSWLVLGEVVAVHIAKWLLKDGIYDTAAAEPILRGGWPSGLLPVGAGSAIQDVSPRCHKT
ncbi:flavin reductase family protein, partial [Klebsiella pneumoniae]|nr:flavin reductase family protein [Klebsiella pneumoniae]